MGFRVKVHKVSDVINSSSQSTTSNVHMYDDYWASLNRARLNFETGDVRGNHDFISDWINFASKHKVACVLAGVATCTIVMCYNKPEIVTNAKEMFAKLFENVSSFAMGK